MKRKKSPFLLLTVLILAGGGLFALSKPFGDFNRDPEELMKEAQEAQIAKSKATMGQSKAATGMGEAVVNAATSGSKVSTGQMAPPPGKGGAPRGDKMPSTLVAPKMEQPKPVRQENSTSSQWFDK